jgi:predicted negative regulator of RcsB-dependent stress response
MAQQYMRLMAHMPLLAHQQPQRALLICFGVGATASAIAAHGAIERIDVVDLNDQVFATAPEFAATNRNVIADPRVRLIHDDGRRFLAATDQTYDLITSEPPPPMFAGVARLYSREYYAQAKARLRPGGLMTQWLPTDQMPRAVMHAAIRSFVEVFADSMLFVGAHTNFILMGCNGPLRLGTLETRLAAEPRVAAELRPFGIRRPLDLILRIVQSGPQLARTTATAPIISDQHNLMSLTFHDPAAPPVVTFDPAAMFADLDAAGTATLACRPEWERIAMHLPRLKSRVPDFPESTLRSVRGLGGRKVEGAEVDWPVVAARMATAEQALAAGQGEAAVAQLEQVVALAPGYTAATRWLGEVLVRLGRPAPALHAFEAVRAADPDDPFGPWGKALVLLQTGQREQALAVLVPALARFADEPMLHRLDGDVLAALSRRGEAVLAYDRALALQPEDQATQQARQRCLTPAAR